MDRQTARVSGETVVQAKNAMVSGAAERSHAEAMLQPCDVLCVSLTTGGTVHTCSERHSQYSCELLIYALYEWFVVCVLPVYWQPEFCVTMPRGMYEISLVSYPSDHAKPDLLACSHFSLPHSTEDSLC